MASRPSKVDVVVRLANGGRLTPEDLALIEAIRKERSILAASRTSGVSYRKGWLMVDALNRTFETPVFADLSREARRWSGIDAVRRTPGRPLRLHRAPVAQLKRPGSCRAQRVSRSGLRTTGQRRGAGRARASTASFPIATGSIIAQALSPSSSPRRSTDFVVTSASSSVVPRFERRTHKATPAARWRRCSRAGGW